MNIHEQLEIAMQDPEQAMKIVSILVDSGMFKSDSQEDDGDWKVKPNFTIDADLVPMDCDHLHEELMSKFHDYNVFETKEECEVWAKRINAMHKLRLIANHLNEGWKPDWKNSDQAKYRIRCNTYKNEGYKAGSNTVTVEGMIYFKDEESVNKAIELMGKESLDDLFGVI